MTGFGVRHKRQNETIRGIVSTISAHEREICTQRAHKVALLASELTPMLYRYLVKRATNITAVCANLV